MSTERTGRDPPVILAGGHGDGGDLRAVAPLAEEGHDEGLDPGGTEKEGEEVGEAVEGVAEGFCVGWGWTSRAGGRGRGGWGGERAAWGVVVVFGAGCAAGFEDVGGDGTASSGTALGGEFFLFELHLDFFHFFADAFVGRDLAGFEEHAHTEDEEETGGKEVGDVWGDEGGDGVAEDGGEDGHGDQGGVSGGEDEDAVVAHSHEGGDEEGLVANFGEENHRKGEEE